MDNRFGRYTTPTHTFTVPLDTSKITLLSIAYEQRGTLVVEKRLEDGVQALVFVNTDGTVKAVCIGGTPSTAMTIQGTKTMVYSN